MKWWQCWDGGNADMVAMLGFFGGNVETVAMLGWWKCWGTIDIMYSHILVPTESQQNGLRNLKIIENDFLILIEAAFAETLPAALSIPKLIKKLSAADLVVCRCPECPVIPNVALFR
uniref:Uncharacterized protein n=1 Tax=Romanomermis culicivorax TaxID=13658 RepID=A0A915IVZ6_ROMCU